MKNAPKSAAILIVLMVFSPVIVALNDMNSPLSEFVSEIHSNGVKRVEVFFLGYDVSFPIPATPEVVREMAILRTSEQLTGQLRDDLLSALERTSLKPTSTVPDLRWGAVFFDNSNKAIFELYLDGRYITGTGKHGVFNGEQYRLSSELAKWLEKHFLR